MIHGHPDSPRHRATVPVELVADPAQLNRLVADCRSAPEIAVDVESNGLHAYRPKLCVVQLAWSTAEGVRVKAFPFAGHPATLKIFCGKRALNLLRLEMLDQT